MAEADPPGAPRPHPRPVLRLVVPDGLGYSSGGTVYNTQLAAALRRLGAGVDVVGVPGGWPVGSAGDRARLTEALEPRAVGAGRDRPSAARPALPRAGLAGQRRSRAAGPPEAVLVDGLVALGAPDSLRTAAAACAEAGVTLGILVHMSLVDAPGLPPAERAALARLEGEALAAVPLVVAPSEFAARRLAERYGKRAHVARPGVVRAPEAPGTAAVNGTPHILCLAALLPGKGQLRLVRALGALRDEPWTLTLAGHDGADPAYARAVAAEAARLGIADRVRLPGELRGPALAAEWARTDLTVLASASETFGLSVAESLAHGVPAIVGAGTGAAEALGLSQAGGLGPAGSAVEAAPTPDSAAGAADPLTRELARWLGDPVVRARWRAAARAARPLLPGWEATARAVVRAMRPGS